MALVQSVLSDSEQLLNSWKFFREFFRRCIESPHEVSKEEEKKFLEIKSSIAKYQRLINSKIERNIKFKTDDMQNVLRQSVSLTHLIALPDADKKALYATIHSVYVNILTIVGAYRFMLEGYHPHYKDPTKYKEENKFAEMLKNKNFITVIVLAIIGFIVYYISTNM